MHTETKRNITPQMLTLTASLVPTVVGATTLFGWAFGIPALVSVSPSFPAFMANNALAMMLCGSAFAFLSQDKPSRPIRRFAAVAGLLVAVIGALTLAEFLFGWKLGIDQLLFPHATSSSVNGYPGRMSPAAALCHVFGGVAVLLVSLGNGQRWRWPFLSALGVSIMATGVLVCTGYLLSALLHSAVVIYPGLAINSAVSFFFIGFALLSLVYRAGNLTWSIARGPTKAILVGLGFLMLVALVSSVFIYQLQQDTQWVSHTQEVLKEIASVSESTERIENGSRGYVASGDERFLAQRAQTMYARDEHLAKIRSLTVDNLSQQRRLDRLLPLIAQRDRLLEQNIDTRKTGSVSASEPGSTTAGDMAMMDEIRRQIDDMRDEEYRLLEIRGKRSRGSSNRVLFLLPLGLLLSLTMLSTALFYLNASAGERQQGERKLIEAHERLRSSEEQMRLMVSGVKDYAIFMLDPVGNVVSWNLGAQRLKGWSAEEIVGQHFSRFYAPEEVADKLPQRELEIAKAEGQFAGEGWRIRKDGSRFWANVVITPIMRDDGGLLGFSKVTRDTTERRRIERAMKEEEARLAAVIGSAMDAVITVDENQIITLFNPAAEQMFGISGERALGSSLEQLLPERFRATHASHIQKFTQTNISRRKMGALIPIYGLRADGREFPIEASISQAHIAGQVILSVILRDVSERNRSEETLRQNARLLDVAPVLVRDMEDRIVFWSSGLAKLYKFTREEAEGRVSHELLQTKFPEPIEQIRGKLERVGMWEGELLHRDRDGNHVVVNSQWVLDRDPNGKPLRILELSTDITAKKRAEVIQLRSQKLESLGTLAAGISHDFNNILLAITGNTRLAIEDLPPDHPVQQSLKEIAKAGSRATDLVRRILTFSRPDELKRQIVDLRPVMEEALKLVRATLPATIGLQTEFASDLPNVLADSSQLHQIIVNLATNAAHAIGAKSDGLIQARLDAAELTAEDDSHFLDLPPGWYVRLSITDNGCGMDAATIERIYDPFFTTKKPGEGTGLGLSVVHGIMKNHDGGITVYSEPGRGTAFRLFFPAAGAAMAAETKSSSNLLRTRNESILYVDDEEPLVVLAKRILDRMGYKVTGQTNPVEALELFRRNPSAFDAVVTDLAMPQLSGFDLSAQLLALRPNLPIIMTSGFVRPEDQERALRMGLRDLILKPDTIDQLGRILGLVFQAEHIAQPKPVA